jgi:hypothetical protein
MDLGSAAFAALWAGFGMLWSQGRPSLDLEELASKWKWRQQGAPWPDSACCCWQLVLPGSLSGWTEHCRPLAILNRMITLAEEVVK